MNGKLKPTVALPSKNWRNFTFLSINQGLTDQHCRLLKMQPGIFSRSWPAHTSIYMSRKFRKWWCVQLNAGLETQRKKVKITKSSVILMLKWSSMGFVCMCVNWSKQSFILVISMGPPGGEIVQIFISKYHTKWPNSAAYHLFTSPLQC